MSLIDFLDIIRAGGRSSSHSIRNCNLSVVRRERRHETPIYGFTQSEKRRLGEVNQHLRELEYDLHRYTNTYRQSFEGILPLSELEAFVKHVDALSIDDYGLLDFLCITPNPASEKELTSSVEQEDDYFGLEPEDNAGNFSAGRFKDFEEEKDDRQLEYNKVVICFADETRNAKKIQDNLKEMKDCEITRVNHLEEMYPDLLWELNEDERWLLYRSWLVQLREQLNKNIVSVQEQHLKLSIEREELRNIEDLSILRGARVIGMTTTWASKNHRLLHQLRPRVMIIEEAAEVFEGHVVSSLTQYCQHLILIGDHQQLQPNPSVHLLSVKYHLDVSLFERMIRTNVSYNRLGVQHRMRPEISQIVRHIYNDLEDHVSVTEYQDVKGISKNLFFVDHSFQEETSSNTHSKTNLHEASFLIALCHYLLRQGYDSSQITILTTYTGQMFTIRDQAKEWFSLETQPPRVASVDNFQGEENDIILLSLVRSNDEENIGFLKTSNRVCVALSRAKKGLYIVGNRAILAKKSPLWKTILDDLHKNDCVGNSLTLVCKKHGNENHVSSDKEFKEKVPNGGCLQPCQHRLECGHACPEMCHPDDHESYQCKKLCERNVAGCQLEGHKCTKKCYEPCDNNCKYPLEKKLSCGHTMELSCSANVNLAKCKVQCEKTLCCGHRCQDRCSVACTKKCLELVKKTGWSCGHENTIACSATQKDCQVPCNAILDCGHCCPGKCGQCIQGRVHVLCKAKCERNLVCSHSCKAYCTKNCPPCKQPCLRKCHHSQCGHFCGEICIPCKEPCKWECQHFKCTKLCSEMCDRLRCDQPCNRKLQCGNKNEPPHFCRGLCGERCICVLCHKNNKDEPITNIIFGTEDEEGARFIRLKDCEHIFEVTALDKLLDGNDDSNEIKMKLCPLCKRPIEKTWRYANVVKKMHQDIDRVKRKILADAVDLDDRKKLVKHLVHEVADAVKLTIVSNALSKSQPLKKIMKFIEKSSEVNYHEVLLMESQVRLVRNWLLVKKDYKDAMNNANQRCKSVDHIEFIDEMQNIWDRIMFQPSWRVNARILSDLRLELERMSLKKNVLGLQAKLDKVELSLKKADEESIIKLTKTLKDKARIEEDVIEQLAQQIAGIYSKYPQLTPITQQEKVQIVKAIGLKQGHWFKCPQGHVYAIGECGGAMEKSQCPECGAVIGGQQHLLEDGNELAPDMDGAQHPAWSEQANIQNYEMGV